jgi:hypothetical protein
MRLRGNEFCPIHRSVFCRGRKQVPKVRTVRLGVQRIEDPHHPRGYRELWSPAETRKRLNRKTVEQDRKCAICHEEFTDCDETSCLGITLRSGSKQNKSGRAERIQAARKNFPETRVMSSGMHRS